MSLRRCLIVVALAVLASSIETYADERTWTSADGRFTIVAEMIALDGSDVRLKTDDGRTLTVPLSKLTAVDGVYARQKAKEAVAPLDNEESDAKAKPESSGTSFPQPGDVPTNFPQPGGAGNGLIPPKGTGNAGGGATNVDGFTPVACVCRQTGAMLKPGTYHYEVYLPPGYDVETDRSYPCIFVMSPGGKPHGLFKTFANQARQHKWIAVLLMEARNGPWEPIVSNFVAAHDDVVNVAACIRT